MTTRIRILAATAVIAVTVPLVGCSFGSPDPQRSTAGPGTIAVEAKVPDVPEVLRQPRTRVSSVDGVAEAGRLPAVVVGSRQTPDRSPTLAVWTSTDGRRMTRADLDAGSGAITKTFATGSEDVVVVGGMRWSTGASRPVLWSSHDRRAWSSLPLPDGVGDGDRIAAVAMAGDRFILVTTDAKGRASASIRVDREWRRVGLPDPGDGVLLNPTDVAARGDRLVLLARPAREGSTGGTRAFASADVYGRDWAPRVEIGQELALVNGVVATDDGFVATGSAYTGDSVVQRPVAWVSATGADWTTEALDEPADELSRWNEDVDAALGAPTVGADGSVSAVMSNDNSAVSTVWTRNGTWSEVGESGPNSDSGEIGIAFAGRDGTTAVLGSDGHARSGGFASSTWREGTVLAAREDVVSPRDAVGVTDSEGGGVILTATRAEFEVEDSGRWNTTVRSLTSQVAPNGRVRTFDAVPPEAQDLDGRVYGIDREAAVVLGYRFGGSGPVLAGGFSSSDDGEWTPITGFPTDGETLPRSVARIGDRWVVAVDRSPDSTISGVSHAAVFTSGDGVTWTEAAGPLAPDAYASSASAVCEARSGVAVVVGWVEEPANVYRPVVWSDLDGSWGEIDLGDLGDERGYFTSCAGAGDDLIVSGRLGSRSVVVSVDEEGTWTKDFIAGRNDDFGAVVEVDGGYAASGGHGTARGSGPVVWLSPDGERWKPAGIPSLADGSTASVAPLGGDLVVATDPTVADPVLIVSDVRSLVRRLVSANRS